ncbi:hypothetical protein SAMN05216525_109140 [Bradyrhizobium sp. Gha]|nr:hypothetical protein SAMN05216525_109140 [Bradyrhizobium sp. Gha]
MPPSKRGPGESQLVDYWGAPYVSEVLQIVGVELYRGAFYLEHCG